MKTEEQAISGFHPDFIPQDHSPSRPYESAPTTRSQYTMKMGCRKRKYLSLLGWKIMTFYFLISVVTLALILVQT